jgi:hypothetical protein
MIRLACIIAPTRDNHARLSRSDKPIQRPAPPVLAVERL